MAGNDEKIAGLYVEVRANTEKAHSDIENLKKFISQRAEAMELDFKKRKMSFDDTLMKKKVSELVALRAKLQDQFDKRVKMDFDAQSIGQTRDQLNAVNKQLQGVSLQGEKSVSVFSKMKGVLAGLGLTFGAYKIISFLKDSVASYFEQEQAAKKLEIALGRVSKALLDDSAALQKQTTFGDENIMQAQAMIAAFIKDEDVIKSLTRATLDLATAKGMDLVSAADLVAKAVGSSTNALARYGIEITGAVGSTERANSAVTAITKLFGGQASGAAQTYSGKIKQLGNEIDDFQERLGQDLVESATDATGSIHGFLGAMTELDDLLRKMNDKGILGNIITFFENFSTMGFDPKQLSGMSKELKNQIKLIQEFQSAVEKASAQNDSWISPDITNQKPVGILNDKAVPQNIEEVKARIDELTQAQDKLKVGSKEYEQNLKDIVNLQDSLLSQKDRDQKAQDELNKALDGQRKAIDDQLKKVDDKNKLYTMTNDLTNEIYDSTKKQLDALLSTAKTDEDRLKIYQAIDAILDPQLGRIQNQLALEKDATLEKYKSLTAAKSELENLYKLASTDAQRLKVKTELADVEKQIDYYLGQQEKKGRKGSFIEIPSGVVESAKNFAEEVKKAKEESAGLKIESIGNEYEQQRVQIEAEFELRKKMWDQYLLDRAVSQTVYDNAIGDLEEIKQEKLNGLMKRGFDDGLSAAQSIASSLRTIIGSGNGFVEALSRALEIAQAIATIIQSINILGSIFSFGASGGASAATAVIPKAEGGIVANIGGRAFTAPYQKVPKFAGGVKDFIVPPGFPNDSFLMALTSGEKANITPVSEVNKAAAGSSSGNTDRLLSVLIDRVGAVSSNIRALELQVNVTNNAPDIDTQVRKNKRTETKLQRAGLKFNEL